MHRQILATCVFLSTSFVFGGKGAELKPQLAKIGAIAFQDDFSATELGKSWLQSKGEWTVREGALVGREKMEDKHAAVLTLQQPFRNAVLRYSFKIDGATGVNLSLNHAKGHLFRVAVSETGLTITKDKDKKDPASKPRPLAKAEGRFTPGQWHTLLVEIQGDKVVVQADNGARLEARDASLDVDKTGYRFVMRGETFALDDLTIWRVEP
jgi:hypothetical protein